MGFKYGSDKLKVFPLSRPRVKLWMWRAATVILLWLCTVQLSALADLWGPRVLKGWPSCLIASPYSSFSSIQLSAQVVERSFPPESEFLFS
jgi:rhamnogalacturonan I rhamnosyltransferase